MDPLLSFKAFLRVAETGSFSEAARRIGVATSVIKKRVDQLEDSAKVLLIHRSTRKLTLTDAGRRQLETMQRAVNEMEEALASIQRRSTQVEGRLRVKAPSTFTSMYLGDMLNRFQQKHPGIALELMVMDRPVNPLLEGFDLAVGLSPGTYTGVTEFGLCELRRLVVASPAYLQRRGRPDSPRDLQSHDVLNFEPTGQSWSFLGPAGPIVVAIEPRLESNDGRHLLQAALLGNGIASLSSYVVMPSIESGLLEPLLQAFQIPDYWVRLQIPDARRRLLPVQALTTFLKNEFLPAPPWARRADAQGSATSPVPAASKSGRARRKT